MQFLKFLLLFQTCGLSYEIYGISFRSPKTWTIIYNLWNFYSISKNMVCHMQFPEFLSLLQKRGLSYAIFEIYGPTLKTWSLIYAFFEISFPSPKMWYIICN